MINVIKKSVYSIKYNIDLLLIKKRIKCIGFKSHIKKGYKITGGQYIEIGDGVSICEFATLSCFDSYNNQVLHPKLLIGNNVFINRLFTALCANSIEIGEGTFFGSCVTITDENHGTNPEIGSYGKQDLQFSKVKIGHNCWIGDKSVILPGVSIGDFSIIGAGSVVVKSIPSYTIACGNPAKPIKRWDNQEHEWRRIEN